MSASIRDILQSPGIAELRQDLINRLKVPGFTITDELPGAFVRTIWEIEALVVEDLVGIEGTAEKTAVNATASANDGQETSSGDWLTAVAHGLYEIERDPGSQSTQTITLACASGKGPYTITAGQGTLINPQGQRYTPITGGTISGGGTLTIQAISEQKAAVLGLITTLASPQLGGVSVQSSAVFDPGSGPLFGSNPESDASVLARCLARFDDLATDNPDEDDRVSIWARAASTEVTRVRIDVDPVNPGAAVVTVAGASGPVSGGAVTAVQAYIDDRAPITDYITAQNATLRNITATAGIIRVQASQVTAAIAIANAAWLAYLGQTAIGGVVFWSALEGIIMDIPGVIDVGNLQLNGSPDDVILAATEVPVMAGDLSTLTWNGV